MPNDTPPSPEGRAPPASQEPDNEAQEAGQEAPVVDSPPIPSPASSTIAPPSEAFESEESKAQRQRQLLQVTKRAAFLLDLLNRFDGLILAEIAYLYYLEASLPRLLTRLFTQTTLLSPSTSIPYTGPKPYIQTLLLSNTICLLLHIFCALPQPQPGARGYLHGGVWPDFIGQRPPTSRFYLIMLDIIVMGMQFFMLAVNEESLRVKEALKGRKEMEAFQAQERGEVTTSGDIESGDLESAERGEVGRAPGRAFMSRREEREPLMPGGVFPGRPRAPTIDSEESVGRGEEPVYGPIGGPLDEYVSGNFVLGPFHVLHTAKDVYRRHVNLADQSLMAAGYTGGFYLQRAQNRLNAAANGTGG